MKIICFVALIIVAFADYGNYDFATGVGKAQYSTGLLPMFYATSAFLCLLFAVFQLFKDSKIFGTISIVISAMVFYDFFKISEVIIKAVSQSAGREPNTSMLIPLGFIAAVIFLLIVCRIFRMWRPALNLTQKK